MKIKPELEKRAEANGIWYDPALAQLLHIIQFKQVVVRGHKKTMHDLADWEKTIAKSVEQRIEEYCPNCGAEVTDE